ncbi:outer membrane protein assembly factor BamC [Taylorella equigenitalis]|uniref:outer membrane protein assembly factor BamC n=1 Tax=Taylorella equigenitalis TaxID=29575 RepID=UPI000404F69F|nr:outer membrane protein assembly factor BamC [Taylorella equigenitalis]WDU47483.1 outer membrane protein assembly factor BamC [Taylorella equigenitalis]
MNIKNKTLILSALIAGFVLAGCESTGELLPEKEVDYKSAVRGDPLSLPPDLSSAAITPQYSTRDGQASALTFNEALEKDKANKAKGNVVLPQSDNMRIISEGSRRWLQIDADPNDVYPLLLSFWGDLGFTIDQDRPEVGIIRTDWAEDRAKIPDTLLRRTLGSIIDNVYDSGERERFTTRIERVNGRSEVFISNERMEETAMDRNQDTFKWLPAPEDQDLNALMLARLMKHLGASDSLAQTAYQGIDFKKSKKQKEDERIQRAKEREKAYKEKLKEEKANAKSAKASEMSDINSSTTEAPVITGGPSTTTISKEEKVAQIVNSSRPVTFNPDDVALELPHSGNSFEVVKNAITKAGFNVQSLNASSKTIDILYLDTDTGEKREASNPLSRLWGDKGNLTPLPYKIVVNDEATRSFIRVMDPKGSPDNSNTAKRILTVINDNL